MGLMGVVVQFDRSSLTISSFFYSPMLFLSPSSPHHSSSLSPHHSLGRRRSSSSLVFQHPHSTTPTPQEQPAPAAVPTQSPTQSMIVVLASRILQWLHLQPEHTLSWSNPSTPRSSTEELVLPLSASSQKTAFGNVTNEKPSSSVHHFPSVCPSSFNSSLPLIHALFVGACSNCFSDMSIANINGSRFLLHVHPSYLPLLAPNGRGCCSVGT